MYEGVPCYYLSSLLSAPIPFSKHHIFSTHPTPGILTQSYHTDILRIANSQSAGTDQE